MGSEVGGCSIELSWGYGWSWGSSPQAHIIWLRDWKFGWPVIYYVLEALSVSQFASNVREFCVIIPKGGSGSDGRQTSRTKHFRGKRNQNRTTTCSFLLPPDRREQTSAKFPHNSWRNIHLCLHKNVQINLVESFFISGFKKFTMFTYLSYLLSNETSYYSDQLEPINYIPAILLDKPYLQIKKIFPVL